MRYVPLEHSASAYNDFSAGIAYGFYVGGVYAAINFYLNVGKPLFIKTFTK